MNAILHGSSKQMKFHTDLRLVFEALNGRQKEFNWLIEELECNHAPGKASKWLTESYCNVETREVYYQYKDTIWISGEELSEIVYEHDIQFMWAFLSGFSKDYKINIDNLKKKYPLKEGYGYISKKNAKPLHQGAIIEIICFDATDTIILSHDDDLVNKFKAFFKGSIDLDKYVRKLSLFKRAPKPAPSRNIRVMGGGGLINKNPYTSPTNFIKLCAVKW